MNRLKGSITLLLLVVAYAALLVPFTAYMRNKPVEEKLGYVPSIRILRPLSVDHKELVGASLVMKVMMYYGGITQKEQAKVITAPPDYQAMSRLLHAAVKLDPYNMDVYYFAQSFLTWDVRQFVVANDLLKEGMQYRTWDWMLPFFVGFNYAYFLHDYKSAAVFYQKAGEISGQDLHIRLTGKYLQESGQTDHAIAYLSMMVRGARNKVAKQSFENRLELVRRIKQIEIARDKFAVQHSRLPESVKELVDGGYLTSIPQPNGGVFIITPDGTIRQLGRQSSGTTGQKSSSKKGSGNDSN